MQCGEHTCADRGLVRVTDKITVEQGTTYGHT